MFATSLDGTQIAYDCSGEGPAVILLHGGGGSRQEWQSAGYVQRLKDDFTVIALDLRGHGESGAPSNPDDYVIDKMLQDILAVADACGAARFALWGMSFGGKVGRYLGNVFIGSLIGYMQSRASIETRALYGVIFSLGIVPTTLMILWTKFFASRWLPSGQSPVSSETNVELHQR